MKKIGIGIIIVLCVIVFFIGLAQESNNKKNNDINVLKIENDDNNGEEVCKHDFGEASCSDKRICKKCGIEMDPTEHEWNEATCEEPKKCKNCKQTEGEALGHSTKYGKCSRCGKKIDNLEYKDKYAIVSNSDREWMTEQESFTDICISGKIEEIQDMNNIIIKDSENQKWCVGLGTGCDFSKYKGTNCEVYGFSSGRTSDIHDNLPYINMEHDTDHLIFYDGKVIYPKIFESTQQFPNKPLKNNNGQVWVSSNGGKKYHRDSNCSRMKNAYSISRNEAESRGYKACDKCW